MEQRYTVTDLLWLVGICDHATADWSLVRIQGILKIMFIVAEYRGTNVYTEFYW